MSTGLAITLYLAAGLVAGIVATVVARAKYRAATFWMVACFLLPPLLIILVFLPKRRPVRERLSPRDDSFDADNLDEL